MGNIGNTSSDYGYWHKKPSSFKVISATGESIKASDGILTGIFVGSGAPISDLKLWDSATTGTGTVLIEAFIPPAGPTNYEFPNVKFDNGLYLTQSTTGTVIVFYK